MARCPHCDQPVSLKPPGEQGKDEVRREVKGFIKKEVLYSCPRCDRVLGFSYFFGGLYTGRP